LLRCASLNEEVRDDLVPVVRIGANFSQSISISVVIYFKTTAATPGYGYGDKLSCKQRA
jgi:hypothetical protein